MMVLQVRLQVVIALIAYHHLCAHPLRTMPFLMAQWRPTGTSVIIRMGGVHILILFQLVTDLIQCTLGVSPIPHLLSDLVL